MDLKIVQKRKIFFTLSGLLVAVSVLFLSVWGLKLGIDFTGGSLLEVEVSGGPTMTAQVVTAKIMTDWPEIGEVKVQPTGSGYLLRMKDLSEDEHQAVLQSIKDIFISNQEIKDDAGTGELLVEQQLEEVVLENRFESIGPVIGQELKTKALWAIVLALMVIIVFIAVAFRKVSKPVASWKYGVGAIIALVHDVLIVTGIFAVLGHYFLGYEVDILFVTALLTILGYSINDTIVVYDRTRENLIYRPAVTFEETVNRSVNETISRSINTALTTILVLLALYLFGGETIKNFVLALMIGIAVGTYSSIFVASPLLVIWQKMAKKK